MNGGKTLLDEELSEADAVDEDLTNEGRTGLVSRMDIDLNIALVEVFSGELVCLFAVWLTLLAGIAGRSWRFDTAKHKVELDTFGWAKNSKAGAGPFCVLASSPHMICV